MRPPQVFNSCSDIPSITTSKDFNRIVAFVPLGGYQPVLGYPIYQTCNPPGLPELEFDRASPSSSPVSTVITTPRSSPSPTLDTVDWSIAPPLGAAAESTVASDAARPMTDPNAVVVDQHHVPLLSNGSQPFYRVLPNYQPVSFDASSSSSPPLSISSHSKMIDFPFSSEADWANYQSAWNPIDSELSDFKPEIGRGLDPTVDLSPAAANLQPPNNFVETATSPFSGSSDGGGRISEGGSAGANRSDSLNEKRFPCEWPGCDKFFSRRYNLHTHMDSTHRQLKPYSCAHCPKKFGRRHDLGRHLSSVHNTTLEAVGAQATGRRGRRQQQQQQQASTSAG